MQDNKISKKIFDLYKKFIKGTLNVHGIELSPNLHQSGSFIEFSFNNPKDLPYSKEGLSGFVQESFHDFGKFIGLDLLKLWSGKFDINCEDLYVTEELYYRIDNTLKNIRDLKLVYDWMTTVHLKVKHVKTNIFMENRDTLVVENVVKPLSAYYEIKSEDDEKSIENIEVEDAVDEYEHLQRIRRFDDSETNYLIIDSIFDNYPALLDNDWQVNYTTTIFV
jgi:hypothetical protein